MFKMDTVLIRHDVIPRLQDDAEDIVAAVLVALARQLRVAGAPDAPLEEQLRTLLASHLAVQQAGSEMPNHEDLVYAYVSAKGDEIEHGVGAILDLLRPIFARLTQERDEARAERAVACEQLEALSVDVGEIQDERDALRQRAETAECAREEAQALQGDSMRAALAECAALRARVAELEALHEPGADVVERLAKVRCGSVMRALDPSADDADVEYDLHQATSDQLAAEYAGIRAVLSRLAAMGDEAWPSEKEARTVGFADMKRELSNADTASNVYALLRSRLSPVIGALQARLAVYQAAEQRARQVEVAAAEAARLLDAERFDETEAALDAMEAKFGQDEPDIVRLRVLMHFERTLPAPDETAALRARVAELETRDALTVRAYLDHSSGPLDARHTVKLDGETVTAEETWHGPDGTETKRFAVRLPLVTLVHVALNTTPDERAAIEDRTDWRGVDAAGGEES